MNTWDRHRLRRFMNVFDVTANELAKSTGIPQATLKNFFYGHGGSSKIDYYQERLNAFVEARKKAKEVELRQMIKFFKEFE